VAGRLLENIRRPRRKEEAEAKTFRHAEGTNDPTKLQVDHKPSQVHCLALKDQELARGREAPSLSEPTFNQLFDNYTEGLLQRQNVGAVEVE